MADITEKENVEFVESSEVDSIDPYASTEISMWRSVRDNPKVIFYSIIMTLGPMAFGFDIIAVGVVTAIPSFLYG